MVFRIHHGYFKYKVLPFGPTNAPATFHGYINKILLEKFDVFAILHFDEIFIYIESEGKAHLEAFWWVFNQLRKHLLYTNPKKSWFYPDEVRFLDYIVSH